jgi:hypothetical protein
VGNLRRVLMKVVTLDFNQLSRLSYQTAKSYIEHLEQVEAENMVKELQVHIEHLYSQMNALGVGPKEFNTYLGGVKKLEVIYGYFCDRLEGTKFAEVR